MQAFNSNDKRTFSKGLRNALGHCGKQALDSNNKCTFTGPPENIKGAFVCATKALQLGDWQSLGCSRGAPICDAVHLDQLMSKFDLKPQTTHSLVCKLWRRPRWAR